MNQSNFTRTGAPDRILTSGSKMWTPRLRLAVAAAVIGVLMGARPAACEDSRISAFAAANDAAMSKMMAGMNVRSSGDIDRDFVASMIPHHQGAIDMAVAELRYGSNERLRRIAQEIVVGQQQEITAMRMAIDQPPPAARTPIQISTPSPRSEMSMEAAP